MPTLKELNKRIKSIKNTQQITSTMEMVAAARLKKVESQLQAAGDYAKKIYDLTGKLGSASREIKNPLFEQREIKNIAIAVVTSDRGLCGGYNSAIIKKTERFIAEHSNSSAAKISLVTVGKKGYDYFKNKGVRIDNEFLDLGGKIVIPRIDEITTYLTDLFLNKTVDEVYLAYTAYKSTVKYIPTVEKFLNIEQDKNEEAVNQADLDYILNPNIQEILAELLPLNIKNRIMVSISESITSENCSRMIAMKNATDNADELVKDIIKKRNKARQAAITTEILEIVSGAEALKDK